MTESSSPRMAKSTSLGLLDQDGDMHIVDKDDILGLTQDVKNFSDGLGRLKELFSERLGMYKLAAVSYHWSSFSLYSETYLYRRNYFPKLCIHYCFIKVWLIRKSSFPKDSL